MSDFDRKRTICWDCSKACGDCSWSDHWKHKPVDGWTAIRNDLRAKDMMIESYIVLDCPQFVRDSRGFGLYRL